jgi:Na+-driven multidrug efflux pump
MFCVQYSWCKILTIVLVLNTLPFGIGVAASARVGNLIGARSSVAAKYAAHASALLSVVVGLVVMIVMMATRNVCIVLSFWTDANDTAGLRISIQ